MCSGSEFLEQVGVALLFGSDTWIDLIGSQLTPLEERETLVVLKSVDARGS